MEIQAPLYYLKINGNFLFLILLTLIRIKKYK